MTLNISQFTDGTVTGAGIFDLMMVDVSAHLIGEFAAGRINGPDYAQVYLSSMASTQALAMDFLLKKDNVDAQLSLLNQQFINLVTENQLTGQEVTNAEVKETILSAEKCKLDVEFDVLTEQKIKTAAETLLVNQRRVTETAQVSAASVDDNSVIGKQIALYANQADGFIRDAEQKVSKLMMDTWNVRRTTDNGTVADTTNKLDDVSIGRAVDKLLTGINA